MRPAHFKIFLSALIFAFGTLPVQAPPAFAAQLRFLPDLQSCPYLLQIPFKSERTLAPELRTDLEAQVVRNFAQKFATVVTDDFRATSAENLRAIERTLIRQLGAEKFHRLLAESEPLIENIKSKLVIQSETSIAGATSILEEDEFLSLDELIRQRKLPLDRKLHSATDYDIDGIIGQQDTVFLAIKPTNLKRTENGGVDFVFGDVKFLFSEDVLDRGYFSTYPFDNSPERFHLRQHAGASPKKVSDAAALYRKFIFAGKADYERLLRLSIVEHLATSAEAGGLPLTQDILAAYVRFPEAQVEDLKNLFAFWELKIPTRLPLTEVSAVQIRLRFGTEGVVSDLVERLKVYAASKGMVVKITEGFDQTAYEYAISGGAIVTDRRYYSYKRLEFIKPRFLFQGLRRNYSYKRTVIMRKLYTAETYFAAE